jgi:DNA processing protein
MMGPTKAQLDLLALCRIKGVDWSGLAREAQRQDGLDRLLRGVITEGGSKAQESAALIEANSSHHEQRVAEAAAEVERARKAGASLITILDRGYPTNLRLIYNLPPFLFVRGGLLEADTRSVAVVGTRAATEEGLDKAARMASLLVQEGVAVISGLARGIDTEAHRAALTAGGRTIAVLGCGITKTYPPENEELAQRIVDSGQGAVVSQFWPLAPPAGYNFPRRNVVTSGLSQGTVVIEASATSGAKMQARLALEHGKKVFLISSLVTSQEWARKYLARPGAVEVNGVEDVMDHLRSETEVEALTSERHQLILALDE